MTNQVPEIHTSNLIEVTRLNLTSYNFQTFLYTFQVNICESTNANNQVPFTGTKPRINGGQKCKMTTKKLI